MYNVYVTDCFIASFCCLKLAQDFAVSIWSYEELYEHICVKCCVDGFSDEDIVIVRLK